MKNIVILVLVLILPRHLVAADYDWSRISSIDQKRMLIVARHSENKDGVWRMTHRAGERIFAETDQSRYQKIENMSLPLAVSSRIEIVVALQQILIDTKVEALNEQIMLKLADRLSPAGFK